MITQPHDGGKLAATGRRQPLGAPNSGRKSLARRLAVGPDRAIV